MTTSTLVAKQNLLEEYDSEFLELWADNELNEESKQAELFIDHRKKPSITKTGEHTTAPTNKTITPTKPKLANDIKSRIANNAIIDLGVLLPPPIKEPKTSAVNRVAQGQTNIQSRSAQANRRPFYVRDSTKKPNHLKSEIHVVDEQFIRKKTNRMRLSSVIKPNNFRYNQRVEQPVKITPAIPVQSKPPVANQKNCGGANNEVRGQNTKQICERLNLQVRLRNPLATQRSVATQATFDCSERTELEAKLKAAELKVQQLQHQLLQQQQILSKVDNQPCQKCAKRTNQRNIRHRNNQRKYREFFIANQSASSSAPKTD